MTARNLCDLFYGTVDTHDKPRHLLYKKDDEWRAFSSAEFRRDGLRLQRFFARFVHAERIGADEFGIEFGFVRECDFHSLGPVHHVIVRHDVSLIVDHRARTGSGLGRHRP